MWADPPGVHDAAVMHAPEKGIVLKDGPLQPNQSRDSRAEGSIDDGAWSRTVALLVLRYLDALGHGGQRHPTVPQRMRECDLGRQGAKNRVQLAPCRHEHQRNAFAVQPLRQPGCHLGP